MLVQLADAAVDVLWDTIKAGMTDGLLNRFFKQHVLVGMLFKHPLQQQRPPLLLKLSPELLTCFVKFVLVRYIPDWLDVEPLHLFNAATMDTTVIEKQI